jgi:predicted CopG family antitoxin
MVTITTKTIAVSVENYERLKNYGRAGESLNKAIGNLLAIAAGGKSN